MTVALITMIEKIVNKTQLPSCFGKCLSHYEKGPPADVLPHISSYTSHIEEDGDGILAFVREFLAKSGYLMQDSRGFIYLKIDDAYTQLLYKKLSVPRVMPPPYPLGAHISVALPYEMAYLDAISQSDRSVSFSITGCYCASPKHWPSVDKVWYLSVESPQLESIRYALGMPPHIFKGAFHITFAIQKYLLQWNDVFTAHEGHLSNLQWNSQRES